jgi:hypothetical protein
MLARIAAGCRCERCSAMHGKPHPQAPSVFVFLAVIAGKARCQLCRDDEESRVSELQRRLREPTATNRRPCANASNQSGRLRARRRCGPDGPQGTIAKLTNAPVMSRSLRRHAPAAATRGNAPATRQAVREPPTPTALVPTAWRSLERRRARSSHGGVRRTRHVNDARMLLGALLENPSSSRGSSNWAWRLRSVERNG